MNCPHALLGQPCCLGLSWRLEVAALPQCLFLQAPDQQCERTGTRGTGLMPSLTWAQQLRSWHQCPVGAALPVQVAPCFEQISAVNAQTCSKTGPAGNGRTLKGRFCSTNWKYLMPCTPWEITAAASYCSRHGHGAPSHHPSLPTAHQTMQSVRNTLPLQKGVFLSVLGQRVPGRKKTTQHVGKRRSRRSQMHKLSSLFVI